MPITIQEIIASDTISQFVDKTNFNFDQLLLNGGGPGGPIGPKGPTGPGGGRGPKGSTWYEDLATSSPGNNPNTVSPTATPFDKDYYLQFNGEVWEYNGTTAVWDLTTIDLRGPAGAAGGGGGFGLTIGSPVINQSNIRYNGPIGGGANGGANATNEGVPSVLIGGVTSQTNALTGIPFTGAYIVPNAIISGNSSPETSLLIHQKNSQTRGIVFHGGADIGSGDNFEQLDPSQLANIGIDVDDSLLLSVPKAATTPTSQTQLLGFKLLTGLRGQQFFAGSDISIQSGTGPSTIDFAGQHSNIEINVGTGGTSGAGSLFKAITQGSISSTLLEAGNSSQITLVTNQALQSGEWQLQAGEIRMVSANTKNLRLYSGGDLRLNTLGAGSSTGGIVLSAGIGGINLNSTNLGNLNGSANNIGFSAIDEVSIFAGDNMSLRASDDMTIVVDDGDMIISQLANFNDGTTLGRNIDIQNSGIADTASNQGTLSQRVGRITAKNYTQIILAHYGQDVEQRSMPSIVIDQNYSAANSIKVFPHTRFVGQQTWQRDAFGSADNTGGILYPQGDSPAQYNALDGLVTAQKNFRQTGNSNLDGISPGVGYELWSGGIQTSGRNINVDAGTIKIFQGIELPNSALVDDPWFVVGQSQYAWDSSLTLAVRDRPNNSASIKQFFSTNSNKTAIGNPLVYNRTQDYTYHAGGGPTSDGNTRPLSESSLVYAASSTDAMTQNSPIWGFDFRNDVLPSSTVTSFMGMPTTADLTSPLIKLQFGLGVGRLTGSTVVYTDPFLGTTTLGQQTVASGVDCSFGFPPGMYPGQRITLIVENYAVNGRISTTTPIGGTFAIFYGNIRINIPSNRSATTEAGLMTAGWYYDGGVYTNQPYSTTSDWPATNFRRNFVQFQVETEAGPAPITNDAANCTTKTMLIDMIWDGTVTSSWGGVTNTNLTPAVPGAPYTPAPTVNEVWTQAGWRVISTENTNKFGTGRYGRNTWQTFP